MQRRNFLKTAAAAGVGAAAARSGLAQSSPGNSNAHGGSRPESPDMPYRELGKTRDRVSGIGLGGYHIGNQPDARESIQLIRSAVDRGITFMDNCWDYNDGLS